VQSTTSSTEHTVAPGLLLDGGVLIGSSPGAKLFLGGMLAVEFAPQQAPVTGVNGEFGTNPSTGKPAPYGTPALNIAGGTQVSVGPVLALQFGY
jgi:hypothetical protein